MLADQESEDVNPHYLNHVIAVSGPRGVQASEDIFAGNGLKLLPKGARIDGAARERLLQHKLRKPLENCVQVVDGVIVERLAPVADELLSCHPLLRSLCAAGPAPSLPDSLARLKLSVPLRSLLSLYCESGPRRIVHAVGVAMLAFALARKLLPGEIDRHRCLATAGLVHDIGELYLDPRYLHGGVKLGPQEWRHIVAHPVVAHRVLRHMEGAGSMIANSVLWHHERLDGFGYPQGIRGDAFAIDGQILGAAEWLMAIMERSHMPLVCASVATRFVPGEFSQAILGELAAASKSADQTETTECKVVALEEAVPRVLRMAATLRRFREAQDWIHEQIRQAGAVLRPVLETGLERMLQIQKAFSSTGLDAHKPQLLLYELGALHDANVTTEVMAVVHELEWRLRELERAQLLRAAMMREDECNIVSALIDRLKGVGAQSS